MKLPRWSQLSLASRIGLVTVVMIATSTMLSLVVVFFSLRLEVRRDIERELRREGENLTLYLEQRGQFLSTSARTAAATPQLMVALAGRFDTEALEGVARVQREALGQDLLALLDGNRTPLAAHAAFPLTGLPPFEEDPRARLYPVGDKLLLISVVPVESDGLRLGFVALGMRIGDEFAQAFFRQSAAEVVIGSPEHIFAAASAVDPRGVLSAVAAEGFSVQEVGDLRAFMMRVPFGRGATAVLYRDASAEIARFQSALLYVFAIGHLFAALAGAIALGWMRRIGRPLKQLTEIANRVVNEEDFSQTIELKSADEVGQLGAAMAKMMEKLRTVLIQLKRASDHIAVATDQILVTSREQESGAANQLNSVNETSSTTGELAKAASQISTDAAQVATIAEETLSAARTGQQAAEGFTASIEQLKQGNALIDRAVERLDDRTRHITRIVETISALADKADVLALNAELEGAKAGEIGRGFSLVASEVRRHAESVLTATRGIEGLIEEINRATSEVIDATRTGSRAMTTSADLSDELAGSLKRIVELADKTTESARSISTSTEQQRGGTEQLVTSIETMLSVTERGMHATRATSAANQDLAALARELRSVVERFKVSA